MNRRASARTETSLTLRVHEGPRTREVECVDLSHTGLRVRAPAAPQYFLATLVLPDGQRAELLAQAERADGAFVGCSWTAQDEASEARVTDFLYECLHRDGVVPEPARSGTRLVARRVA